MAKTTTVSFKRFRTKNGKNQKTESAKIEDSSFHNHSHFNHKTMTNLENLPHIPKTTLVVIPIEQLAEMMQGIVKAELANHKPTASTPPDEEYLNAGETISFLKVCRPTYQKLRREGKIEGVHVSDRRILFRKSDLIAYLNSRHESRN